MERNAILAIGHLAKVGKIFAQGGVPGGGPKGMLRKDCGGSEVK